MLRFLWIFFITGRIDSCFEHDWKIVNTEILKPMKLKYIIKLLPKLSADQEIDFDHVTFITYKCSKCLDFRQKKLVGRIKNGQ